MEIHTIGEDNGSDVKKVYILSDGTGQSAINVVRACLIQFDNINAKLIVYSKMDDEEKIKLALSRAKEDKAFVAFTIATKSLRRLIHTICHEDNIMHHDILGPPVEKFKIFLDSEPREFPNLLRRLDSKYFKRIEAIDFAIEHDDGKSMKRIREADIVILGLSRTSKTPTSFYLAQMGYKVVNIPLIYGMKIPEEVYSIDQNKIICLVMDPETLQKIRQERLRHYKTNSDYTNIKKILEEVEFIYELVSKNRKWHLVDTTNKSVEETAREIIVKVYGRELEL
ncbi:pyruvate, water dikinase regulatory protein [Calditerrivibrio sp.]|jgi:regulator of PEP synthase PpsR (kinase-PPPase family)|uniref:Putative pyruvate, phosphate dikinase regulatory protein n=1 Tax=Calditerrivibrio nitroreducens TaxID=477976 RepID=A0A2J6WGP3_9BACT|nr:MAG: kinase/pyrophosphorylase [Calditerrivibrio nitroreducens]